MNKLVFASLLFASTGLSKSRPPINESTCSIHVKSKINQTVKNIRKKIKESPERYAWSLFKLHYLRPEKRRKLLAEEKRRVNDPVINKHVAFTYKLIRDQPTTRPGFMLATLKIVRDKFLPMVKRAYTRSDLDYVQTLNYVMSEPYCAQPKASERDLLAKIDEGIKIETERKKLHKTRMVRGTVSAKITGNITSYQRPELKSVVPKTEPHVVEVELSGPVDVPLSGERIRILKPLTHPVYDSPLLVRSKELEPRHLEQVEPIKLASSCQDLNDSMPAEIPKFEC